MLNNLNLRDFIDFLQTIVLTLLVILVVKNSRKK